jgi:hypothetical protein
MLTVACVLSEGPRRAYDRSHVARLQAMVARHLDAPHAFVCIDDAPWPGWWAKIALFAPGRFAGRVLYLDLDVTITGDLAPLAHFPAPFAIVKDWNRPGFNSSVIAWDAGAVDRLYIEFDADVMARLAGDQDWINERMPDAATFPLGWCASYRRHVRTHNHVPGSARVICYHGFPKPWDVEAA